MSHPLNSIADLADAGLIAPERAAALGPVAQRYAVGVTPESASLIDPHDPRDPIGLQFLPQDAERRTGPEESGDPIGDAAHSPVPGVVHRYPDRALLLVTHACASYCRFCFRRERVGPGGAGGLTGEALEAALAYIAEQSQIWEVILTGGDPLVLSARRLGAIMDRLARIDHVKVVRIHTRVPAVDPARITPGLVAALKRAKKPVYIALHANHARELTPAARAACVRLIDAGFPMLSQTVLLRHVNDNAETLGELMRAFVETRIRPYYLHLADPAPGTAHLRVGLAEGQAIMRAVRGRLSGLCQPTFVLDIPGGFGKVPVGPGYLAGGDDDRVVEDPWGARHPFSRTSPTGPE